MPQERSVYRKEAEKHGLVKPALIPLPDAKLQFAALPDNVRREVFGILEQSALIDGRPLTKLDLDKSKGKVPTEAIEKAKKIAASKANQKPTIQSVEQSNYEQALKKLEGFRTKVPKEQWAKYGLDDIETKARKAAKIPTLPKGQKYASTLGEGAKLIEQKAGEFGKMAGAATGQPGGAFLGEQLGYVAATPITVNEGVQFFVDPNYRAQINPQGTSAGDYTGAALKLWLNVGAPGAGRVLSPALKAAGTSLEKAGVKLVESGSLLGKPILQAKLAKEINALEFGKELVKHGVPAKEASRAAYFATRAFQQSSAEDLDLAFSRYKIEQKALPGKADTQLALPEPDPIRDALRTGTGDDIASRLSTAPEQAIPPGGYFTEPAVPVDAPTPVPKKVDKPMSEAPMVYNGRTWVGKDGPEGTFYYKETHPDGVYFGVNDKATAMHYGSLRSEEGARSAAERIGRIRGIKDYDPLTFDGGTDRISKEIRAIIDDASSKDTPSPASALPDNNPLGTPIKGTQESTPTKTPLGGQKPVTEAPGAVTDDASDAFGLATKFEEDFGVPGEKHGVRVQQLADVGLKVLAKNPDRLKTVYARAARLGGVSPEDGAVAAARGRQIANRTDEITEQIKTADDLEKLDLMAERDLLEAEMGQVLQVGTDLQKTFHQTGQSLKVAFAPDFSRVRILARAQAENYGDALSSSQRSALESKITDLEAETKLVAAERDALKKKIEATKTKPGSTKDPIIARANLAKGILNDLGLGGKEFASGKPMSKQAGALKMPEGASKRVEAKITRLAKVHLEQGAKTLDEVIGLIQKDIPLLEEDDILGLLSGKYKERILAADTKRIAINNQMRKVRAAAEFKRKTKMQKAATFAHEGLVATQRAAQSGLDVSAPFLQGLPGAIVSPSAWAKSWAPGLRPFFKGKKAALLEQAKVEADPAYKFAVGQGKVAFSDTTGPLTKQEEFFQGSLIEVARDYKLPEAFGPIRGVGVPGFTTYAEAIGRSNDGFVAFLNKLRLDLFKKFAKGNYDDPDVLRDAGRLTNILTGRGDGAMAQALSAKGFAYVLYAPRFMYATFQNAALPLLLPTFKSTAGKVNAMKAWSKQVGAFAALGKISEWFGAEYEWDVRSNNFGNVTLPNGFQFNLFKKITDPVRFLARQVGGSFNAKGEYREPNVYNNTSMLGQYLSGKASPIARTTATVTSGQRYDRSGELVDFDPTDPESKKAIAIELAVPISWQQALDSDGDESAIALSIFGIDVTPSSKKKPKAPPVPWRESSSSTGRSTRSFR